MSALRHQAFFGRALDTTVLLLHMDGANGSTTFTDSSATPKTITPSGSAQISTAQSKFGGASGLFNGTASILRGASSSVYDILAGDCTLETFIYPLSSGTGTDYVLQIGSSLTNRLSFYLSATRQPTLYTEKAGVGAVRITGAAISLTTWTHLAIVKSGSTWTLYINGVSAGTSTTTDYPSGAAQQLNIGAYGFGDIADTEFMHAHLDEFRLSSSARYTAGFIPPSAPF